MGFFILEKFWTGVSCFLVTLFYSTLLALTDRQNYRQRNKYTRFAWAGGTFSPVVLLCQFSVLAGKRFWSYILLMYLGYRTIQLWCCVSFFGSGGKCTYLVYDTVVRLLQFFCCGGKVNCEHRQIPRWFSKKWLFDFFILEKQLTSQNIFLVKSKLSLTTYLFLVFYKSSLL